MENNAESLFYHILKVTIKWIKIIKLIEENGEEYLNDLGLKDPFNKTQKAQTRF